MGLDQASIEAFARASCRLAHPFADRAAELRALGLDEEGWASMQAAWRADIARRGAAAAKAFATAFADEKRRLDAVRPRAGSAAAIDMAPVLVGSLNTTGHAHVVLEPALPFRGSHVSPPPAANLGPLPSGGVAATIEIDVVDDDDRA